MTQAPGTERPLPTVPPVTLVGYVVAQWAHWLAVLTPAFITIALRIPDLSAEDERVGALGAVLALGAVAATVGAPVFGALSDRTASRWGRRRPWMVAGVLGAGVGLALMATADGVVLLGVGWVLAQLSFNANQAALSAVLPDVVPLERRGTVAGLLGLTSAVAGVSGAWLVQYVDGPWGRFLVPWLPALLASALLVVLLRETRTSTPTAPFRWGAFLRGFWIDPRRHRDYAWAFLSRMLVFLGTALLSAYQVFFLTDRLGIDGDRLPRAIFQLTVLTAVVTVVVSALGGWVSDLVGRRKPFVVVGAVIAAVGLVLVATADSQAAFLLGAGVVSLGSGLYYAVDLALVASILPSADDHARDLGTFNISQALPQVIAPAIAPLLLALGAGAGPNYTALFVAAAVAMVLGAWAIRPIVGSR